MRKVLALTVSDLRNIGREPMLLLIGMGPFLLAFFVRWGFPLLVDRLAPGADLTRYYPLLAGILVLFSPFLFGMITGFLLLDERDDNVTPALLVTPLAKSGYLAYRLLWPILFSLLSVLIVQLIAGLAVIPFSRLLLTAAVASLGAPVVALFLLCFAANKVEGLVLAKGLGLPLLLPVATYFLPPGWRWLTGAVPFTWPVQAYLAAVRGGTPFWFALAAGTVIHLGYLSGLLKTLNRRVN